jgi:hypothetical protein
MRFRMIPNDDSDGIRGPRNTDCMLLVKQSMNSRVSKFV